MSPPATQTLHRRVGVAGAVLMGLGSIVGTGVFVSLGLAAGLAGPAVVLALLLAAALATFNGLSSAQLAATWPVSGGTYEYANRAVGPWSGFAAGWMFLTAKSASAATAALGLAGYLLPLVGVSDPTVVTPIALAGVGTLTALVYGGIQRTNLVNAVVVGFTLLALLLLVAFGLPVTLGGGRANLSPLLPATADLPDVLEAAALLFVAYTGYGRIATLGEEVVAPRRTIPRAILATLGVVLVLYVGVAVTALAALGAPAYAEATRATAAPLEAVARVVGPAWLPAVVSVAAVTAMVGVLLNLLLGLSRVLLAMARRGDAPALLARVDARRGNPGPAVLATGLGVVLLVMIGDVKTTWSFSAFTVLVYYALTNLSALRLPPDRRLYPRWTAWAGLCGCASLLVWIEPGVVVAGVGVLLVGMGVRGVGRRV